MLSVTEVAKEFGVTSQTIRSWDKKGILKPTYISPTNRRFYNEEDVNRLREEGYCNGYSEN